MAGLAAGLPCLLAGGGPEGAGAAPAALKAALLERQAPAGAAILPAGAQATDGIHSRGFEAAALFEDDRCKLGNELRR